MTDRTTVKAANPQHASAAVERQTDERTDTRPFRRACSIYYAGSVKSNGQRRADSEIVETDERTRPSTLPLPQQTRGTPLLL